MKRNSWQKILSLLLVIAVIVTLPAKTFFELRTASAQSSPFSIHISVDGPLGSQVNTYTGNFHYEHHFGGVTPQDSLLGPVLTYNSQLASIETLVGFGWSLNFNIFYLQDGDSFFVYRGNGQVDQFTRNGEQFVSDTASRDMFEAVEEGLYRLTTADGTRYLFGDTAHGGVTHIENRNGSGLTFEYVEAALAFVRDDYGRSIQLGYEGNRVTTLVESAGTSTRTFRLAYNEAGELIEITDPMGNSSALSYEAQRLTTLSNPLGQVLSILYDNGKVSELSSAGYRLALDYTDSHTTIVTESFITSERVTQYFYDAQGRISQITDPLGNSLSLQWDGVNLIAYTDALGRTTRRTYDSQGNLITQIDPANQETRYTYDNQHNLTGIINANNELTAFEYDDHGNVTGVTDPTGSTTTLTYNDEGQVVRLEDAAGAVYEFDYDEGGQLVRTVNPLGFETQFIHDDAGNVVQVIDANGHEVEYSYDAVKRVTAITNSLGQQIQFAYDAVGNLTAVTDPMQQETSYVYNQLNQLVQVSAPQTYYGYDGAGSLVSVIDANGSETRYEYDALNRLIRETDPLGNTQTFAYDAVGNLVEKTDAEGNTTHYRYDEMDRLIEIIYADASTVSYTYDAVGRRTSMVDGTGTTTYAYNANGRLGQVTNASGHTVTYTYDHVGNLAALTYPDGTTVTYEYDAAQQLTAIESALGRVEYTYDPAGRLIERLLPNGVTTNYQYDAADQLTGLEHVSADGATLLGFEYELNNAGLRTAVIETGPDGDRRGTRYEYDALYRLTEVSNIEHLEDTEAISNRSANLLEAYTYDAAGNRLTETPQDPEAGGIGQDRYTYNAANQLLQIERATNPFSGVSRDLNTSFEYDANGNLIAQQGPETTWRYEYDLENRLTGVTEAETTTDFIYDGDGNRIAKTVNGSMTSYVHNINSPWSQVLVEMSGDSQRQYLLGLTRLGYQSEEGEAVFYLEDGLNSVVAQLDASGAILQTHAYSSFGIPDPELPVSDFGFTGEQYDAETGLLYLRARYHMPQFGRFTAEDAFKGFLYAPESLHPYVYVQNNPVNFIDPSGHLPIVLLPLAAAGLTYLGNVGVSMTIDLAAEVIVSGITGAEVDVVEVVTRPSNWLPAGGIIKAVKVGHQAVKLALEQQILKTIRDNVVPRAREFARDVIEKVADKLVPDPPDFYSDPLQPNAEDGVPEQQSQQDDSVPRVSEDISDIEDLNRRLKEEGIPVPGPALEDASSLPELTETYILSNGLRFNYPEGWFVDEGNELIYITNNERIANDERIVPDAEDVLITITTEDYLRVRGINPQDDVSRVLCRVVNPFQAECEIPVTPDAFFSFSRQDFTIQGRLAIGVSDTLSPDARQDTGRYFLGFVLDHGSVYVMDTRFLEGNLERHLPVMLAIAESFRDEGEGAMEVITVPAPTEIIETAVPPTGEPEPTLPHVPDVTRNAPSNPSGKLDWGGISFTDIFLSNALDQSGCPIEPVFSFAPHESIYVVVMDADISAGTTIYAVLSSSGLKEESAVFTAPENHSNVCLNFMFRSQEGYEAGSYSIELFANGSPLFPVSFDIVAQAEETPTEALSLEERAATFVAMPTYTVGPTVNPSPPPWEVSPTPLPVATAAPVATHIQPTSTRTPIPPAVSFSNYDAQPLPGDKAPLAPPDSLELYVNLQQDTYQTITVDNLPALAQLSSSDLPPDIVAYSPDLSTGVSIEFDGDITTVSILDLVTGHEIAKLTGHEQIRGTDGLIKTYPIVYSADGTLLFVADSGWGDAGGNITIWDMQTFEPVAVLQGRLREDGWRISVDKLVVSPDNRYVLAADDMSVRSSGPVVPVWDITTQTVAFEVDVEFQPDLAVFSNDGERLFLPDTSSIQIWDTNTGSLIAEIAEGLGASTIVIDPTGHHILVSGRGLMFYTVDENGEVTTAELDRYQREAVFIDGQYISGSSMMFSEEYQKFGTRLDPSPFAQVLIPGPDHFYIRSANGFTEVVNGITGEVAHTLDIVLGNEHTYTPDFTRLITVRGARIEYGVPGTGSTTTVIDQTINPQTFRQLQAVLSIDAHEEEIHQIAFSPDGRLVATAGGDGYVRIWDVSTGQLYQEFEHEAYKLQFSPGGSYLTSAGLNDAVIWNIEANTAAYTYAYTQRVFYSRSNPADALAIAPDGRYVATVTGVSDGGNTVYRVAIWDIPEGQLCCVLDATDIIQRVAFDPTNNTLVVMHLRQALAWDLFTASPRPVTDTAYLDTLFVTDARITNPDGSVLSFRGNADAILGWLLESPQEPASVLDPDWQMRFAHTSYLTSVALAPDNLYLATADENGELKFWVVGDREDEQTSTEIGSVAIPAAAPLASASATPLPPSATSVPAVPSATPVSPTQTPTPLPVLDFSIGNMMTTLFPEQPEVQYAAQLEPGVAYNLTVVGQAEVMLIDQAGSVVSAQEVDRINDEPVMRIGDYTAPNDEPILLVLRSLQPETPQQLIITFERSDPLADFECAGTLPPRLRVGSTGRVIPGPANNVRASAGLGGEKIGQIPGGGVFTVLENPVCADSYVWWRVDYEGLIGWTAEAAPDEYWIEPWE